ncbi:tegument serine/threonine protein kinase [Cervid alphaherpesvirus 2]|uniref:Tegument serine/threonine protein kinase n=1 Tax=Cervid alphaherpesvirus 2 TaxID=365327 RepID=A0A455JQ69_9ALPH|nr:tegument serine/threonine protein kinase [Cervid alphaherpesvirus 2]AVT50767.1 tegument serine/threonine protein kinase [Cervid alphaherpesvirus 2]
MRLRRQRRRQQQQQQPEMGRAAAASRPRPPPARPPSGPAAGPLAVAPEPGAAGPLATPPPPSPPPAAGSALRRAPIRPPSRRRRRRSRARVLRLAAESAPAARPVFLVDARLRMPSPAELGGPARPRGAGGYGSVVVHEAAGVAVKTFASAAGFEHELLMTLLAGECSLRALRHARADAILRPCGFSLPRRQLAMPAFDADLAAYAEAAGRAALSPAALAAAERAFVELGRAVVFLNASCGLAHLDIKGGNIFVNTAGALITRAVLGDFSLMTLTAQSALADAEFLLAAEGGAAGGEGAPLRLRLTPAARLPAPEIVLGHCATRPPEVLLEFLNRHGLGGRPEPLPAERGLAIDLYALGHALLELVLTGAREAPEVQCARRQGARLMGARRASCELAVDILAHRCALLPLALPATARTTACGGAPWDEPAAVRAAIRGAASRAAFDRAAAAHRARYSARLREALAAPPVRRALELAALLCHRDPRARRAVAVLWP